MTALPVTIDLTRTQPREVFDMPENNDGEEFVVVDEIGGEDSAEESSNLPGTSGQTGAQDFGALNTSSEEDAGSVCTVCFEHYTSSGRTRVVCLPCGHLFCKSCAESIVNCAQRAKSGLCPQCRRKYKCREIRQIFATKIKMMDTSELEDAKRQREEVLREKRKLEVDLTAEKQRSSEHCAKIIKLETQLQEFKRFGKLPSSQDSNSAASLGFDPDIFSTSDSPGFPGRKINTNRLLVGTENGGRILVEQRARVEICRNGHCKVTDTSVYLNVMLASYGVNPGAHFNFHGIKRVDLTDFRVTSSLGVHSDEIKDVKLSPNNDGMFLSASKDKTLKLSSLYSNSVVHSYTHDRPIFSCCWKRGAPHYIFCGAANGKVFLYDTRTATGNGDTPVTEITGGESPVPVTSLQWIDCASEASASSSGLLVGRLNSCTFYEASAPEQFTAHRLPYHGNLTSLSHDNSTGYFLTTSRPKIPDQPQVAHQFCEFTYENVSDDPTKIVPKYSSNVVQTFTSGKSQPQLTRNVLFSHPHSETRCLAAVLNHGGKSVNLWDSGSGSVIAEAKVSSNPEKVTQIDYADVGTTSLLNVTDGTHVTVFGLSER